MAFGLLFLRPTAAPAAPDSETSPTLVKAAVVFDAGGWRIDDTPLRLFSAELDYARLPRGVWKERIFQARAAGFNALTLPIVWSLHEPRPGVEDFEGAHDLAHLLEICRDQGMYVVVRAGPWIGGDWGLGGLPEWLIADPIRVRMSDPAFLAATDRWFGRLATLIAERQVHRGGCVIAVEVDGGVFGTNAVPDPYYPDHLESKLRELGIEVPVVRSDPAEDLGQARPGKLLDYRLAGLRRAIVHLGRPSSWGEAAAERDLTPTVARVISSDVAWLDCRNVFGGSNFGFKGAEDLPARHDCGAPIGRAGQLRPAYYHLKRELSLAAEYAPLTAATNAERTTVTTVGGGAYPARRFRSADGEVTFIENPWPLTESFGIQLSDSSPATETIVLPGRTIQPVVRKLRLSDTLSIEGCAAPLIDAGTVDGRRLLVAEAGHTAGRRILFRTKSAVVAPAGSTAVRPTGEGCLLSIDALSTGQLRSYDFVAGDPVQVVAVGERLFDQTWRLGDREVNGLLIGGDALLDAEYSAAGMSTVTVGSAVLPSEYRLYSDADRVESSRGSVRRDVRQGCWVIEPGEPAADSEVPQLGGWQQCDDGAETSGQFNDRAWRAYPEPLSIERLETAIDSQYAWYRANLNAPLFSTYTLRLGGIGDRAWVFVNGLRTRPIYGRRTDEISFVLPGGPYTLALLVEHAGRDDLEQTAWQVPEDCRKGLRGPAAFVRGPKRWEPPAWQFTFNNYGPEEAGSMAGAASAETNWQTLGIPGPDDMNGQIGFAWYRFTVRIPNHETLELALPPADDLTWVYLSGRLVGRHNDPKRFAVIRVPDSLPVRAQTTTHTVSILVENRRGSGGLAGPVGLSVAFRDPLIRPFPWRMRVGLAGEIGRWYDPASPGFETAAWATVSPPTARTTVRWYRTAFDRSPAADCRQALFFNTGGLVRGVAWLNGRCLGRYRKADLQVGRGIYLPSSWLREKNWLVVAETDAGLPGEAHLERLPQARLFTTTLRINHTDGRAAR